MYSKYIAQQPMLTKMLYENAFHEKKIDILDALGVSVRPANDIN